MIFNTLYSIYIIQMNVAFYINMLLKNRSIFGLFFYPIVWILFHLLCVYLYTNYCVFHIMYAGLYMISPHCLFIIECLYHTHMIYKYCCVYTLGFIGIYSMKYIKEKFNFKKMIE